MDDELRARLFDPQAARRVERLLRSPTPLPLAVLATEVDALGAAAIGALAETSAWTVPARR
jgi:hypothetical protein